MIYPVLNYKTEWFNSSGYDFGDRTPYGYHDGKDLNDNGAGNSDLGKPLYAVAKGKVVGIHNHTEYNTFGKHFFVQIDGPWGTRYVHYAHCNETFVYNGQIVEEGQKIATVGRTGTIYSHCHFAIKKKANGMDTVASNWTMLNDAWEDPITFIEQYMKPLTVREKEILNIMNSGDDDRIKVIKTRDILTK